MDSIAINYPCDVTPCPYVLPAHYSLEDVWEPIEYFTSEEFVAAALQELHGEADLPGMCSRDRSRLVAHSVSQAKEHFDAASNASLHASPELLYYGAMSLAAATIAFRMPTFQKFSPSHGFVKFHNGDDILSSSCKMGDRGTFHALSRLVWADVLHLPHRLLKIVDGQRIETDTHCYTACRRPDWQVPYASQSRALRLGDLIGEIPDLERTCRQLAPSENHLVEAIVRVTKLPDALHFHVGLVDKDNEAVVRAAAQSLLAQLPGWDIRWMEDGGALLSAKTQAGPPEKVPLLRQASDDNLYISVRASSAAIPELCCYYAAAYMLSMMSRYHPLEWVEVIHSEASSSLLLSQFVRKATRRLPLLFLREIWGRYVGPE